MTQNLELTLITLVLIAFIAFLNGNFGERRKECKKLSVERDNVTHDILTNLLYPLLVQIIIQMIIISNIGG